MNMLAIGTPYKENSVSAIARSATQQAELDTFFTTTYTAQLAELIKPIQRNKYAAAIHRELERRAYPGIPRNKVRSHAVAWDLGIIALRRLRFDHLSSRYVFIAKRQFDAAMALNMKSSRASAVLGMWGSCEATFSASRQAGKVTVLNYVNSHPSEQNRLMSELGNAPQGHSEFIPEAVVKRVEKETALADIILVPSNFVARQLLSRGVPSERIALQPYGVDLRAFHPPKISRNYTASTRLQVLCVAMVSYRKGTVDVISAARKMKHEADFHLMGPVLERDLLRSLPENVTYYGVKVQREVVAAMHAADVLVLASVDDAYPLVVLEAMATALPVVISDHAGGGESVTTGLTGYVFPARNVDLLISSLRLLHAEPALRERIGRNARHCVEGAASWESYALRVIECIRRVVQSSDQAKPVAK